MAVENGEGIKNITFRSMTTETKYGACLAH